MFIDFLYCVCDTSVGRISNCVIKVFAYFDQVLSLFIREPRSSAESSNGFVVVNVLVKS